MSFSLRALLYVVLVLAACLSLFGSWGIAVAFPILHGWGAWHGYVRQGVFAVLFTWVVLLVLVAMLMPAVQISHGPSRENTTKNNLRQLMLATTVYETMEQRLPPPFTEAADGTRLHSWRTQLWPYLEMRPAYDKIDWTKPWDDPGNSSLLSGGWGASLFQSMRYRLPQPTDRFTNFFAVVGPVTAFPPTGAVKFADVTDGTSNTIAFIEVDRTDIDIMEPRDLTLDEAVDLLSDNPGEWTVDGLFVRKIYKSPDPRASRIVAFLDGRVERLPPVDRATARALLTRAGGEPIDADALESQYLNGPDRPTRMEIIWINVFRTLLFVGVLILPAFWRRHLVPSLDDESAA